MDLARGVDETPQNLSGMVGMGSSRLLMCVDNEVAVESAKGLIPDAGHAVADHPHVHAETDPEEDAVEERERSAERVVDGVY